jgi:hypothetical protein
MITFHYIKFKNLLSYGNTWTKIELDKNQTTLFLGKNGSGKCLDPTTGIDIEIEDEEIRKIFEEFVKNR